MKITKAFIEYIEKYCKVDERQGCLICSKCGKRVIIDWFEKTLECLGCDEL